MERPRPTGPGRVKPDWEECALRGDAAGLLERIRAGADVDALDRHGQSALMLAAQRGHLEAVRVLLRAGADLDVTAKFGLSATMLAVVNGHAAIARALAKAGADLRLRGSGAPGFAGRTASQLACDGGLDELGRDLAPDDT